MYRNKLVLSQLPSPFSTVVTPIRLYPWCCTLYSCTISSSCQFCQREKFLYYFASTRVRHSPFCQFRQHEDFSLLFPSVWPIGYNSLSIFRSDFASKSTNKSILLDRGWSYHSTLFLNVCCMTFVVPILLSLFTTQIQQCSCTDLGPSPTQRSHSYSGCFNPVFLI